jgi:Mn2+/Fe2+ NRAMP family transporter
MADISGSDRRPQTAVEGARQESDVLRHTGRAGLVGAMFLMATSAIGPGFLTQTTTFTVQLGAAFAFAILVALIVDIAIQLNIWRIIGISGRRAQDLANSALPGSGYALAALDVFGGLVFNIGNIAGTSLGLDALFGLDVKVGGTVSALIAIAVFLIRRAGVAMDRVVVGLGVVMLLLTTYVAIKTTPPVGDALRQSPSRRQRRAWCRERPGDQPRFGGRHRDHGRDADRALPRCPGGGHGRRQDRHEQPGCLRLRLGPR